MSSIEVKVSEEEGRKSKYHNDHPSRACRLLLHLPDDVGIPMPEYVSLYGDMSGQVGLSLTRDTHIAN